MTDAIYQNWNFWYGNLERLFSHNVNFGRQGFTDLWYILHIQLKSKLAVLFIMSSVALHSCDEKKLENMGEIDVDACGALARK
jgi:hypothetical protein